MYNNIYLGSTPDTSGLSVDNLDSQIRQLNAYKMKLQELQNNSRIPPAETTKSLWTSLDAELESMTEEQLAQLSTNPKYVSSYNQIQTLVQQELMNLVKGKIENSEQGKKLLESHLEITKGIKSSIIQDAKKEMELFLKFKEYAKSNPNATYEEFLKASI
jgi:DNA-binding FadR family transcriptional regulator